MNTPTPDSTQHIGDLDCTELELREALEAAAQEGIREPLEEIRKWALENGVSKDRLQEVERDIAAFIKLQVDKTVASVKQRSALGDSDA